MKLGLGGTFDALHEGHKKLIQSAFDFSDDVVIGLTSDDFASKSRGLNVNDFNKRKKSVEGYVRSLGKKATIVEINSTAGSAASDESIDGIVASVATYRKALAINKHRKKPLFIIAIPMVKNKKGKTISSTLMKRNDAG